MNRFLTIAALVASLLLVDNCVFAQKVTLRTTPKTPTAESNPTAPISEPAPAEASSDDIAASAEASSNDIVALADVLTLIQPPATRLAPATDEERDAKYPVVPDALRMALEELVPTKELFDVRVLKAMARIPRAEFVGKEFRDYAYQDAAIPIGESQTISPPFIVAYMTETLDPRPTDRVLEIGTGSGYQAAVLSCLTAEVYTIEIVKSLGVRAAETLKKLKYDNVFVRVGDGYQGWPEAAPFDKIIVTCSPENIPQPLIDQLKEGGKMLIPVGERYRQYFELCEKKEGKLVRRTLIPACFVPMTGEAESKREKLPNPAAPELIGGGFETTNPSPIASASTTTAKDDSASNDVAASVGDSSETAIGDETSSAALGDGIEVRAVAKRPTPEGWYSTRNVYVADRADAPEGRRVCVCDNASVEEEHRKKDANEARFAAATLPELRQNRSADGFAFLKERQRESETICHLRQNFAVDGVRVKRLTLTGQVRAANLRPKSPERQTIALIKIYFFDRERKTVGGETIVLAAPFGSFDWREFAEEVAVPKRATEASLQVGILDGIGTVEFDALTLKNKYEYDSRQR